MAKFEHCSFSKTTIVLDGNEYIDCNFKECRVVVTRGDFILKKCNFDGCVFEFGGEAENIKYLVMGLLGQPDGSTKSQQIKSK